MYGSLSLLFYISLEISLSSPFKGIYRRPRGEMVDMIKELQTVGHVSNEKNDGTWWYLKNPESGGSFIMSNMALPRVAKHLFTKTQQ